MSNWNNIIGTDLEKLASTRKALHQAIQIVGAVPRNLLPHDPTDTTASLLWNESQNGLQCNPIPSSDGHGVKVGLSIDRFALYILKDDQVIESLPMDSLSTMKGLEWVQEQMIKQNFDGQKINLNLPYEIEDYDYSESLQIDEGCAGILASLYANTSHLLSSVAERWEKAYDIRCWPHHFDLATLIPIETDSKGEITKSIGVGLSPGDEGIKEPYLYINVWPSIDDLEKHQLPAGHWNKEGWSGAVLTLSELIAQSNQEKSFDEFTKEAIKCISKEI